MTGGERDRRLAEREAADRRYNDALTALDGAVPPRAELPAGGVEIGADSAALRLASEILPPAPPPARGWRGRLARFVWRTIGPSLSRQQAFNEAAAAQVSELAATVAAMSHALDQARAGAARREAELATFHSHLLQYLQQITPFVDSKMRVVESVVDELRMAAVSAQRSAVAARRGIERLAGERSARPEGEAPAGPSPAQPQAGGVGYVGFEDLFRGSSEDVRTRQVEYADLFAGASDVLDVGCGRGELLELLRDRGVPARGIDVNAEMVEVCRARGLEAHHADALAYLGAQPDARLGGLVAVQVVEHFDPGYLVRLLETAHTKLRPGATIVLETINVACWVAFFESYVRDITHVRPLHPDTLKFLVVAAGFEGVDVRFRSPVSESGRLQQVGEGSVPASLRDLARAFNGNVERLNERLFTYLDYAVIGRKPA